MHLILCINIFFCNSRGQNKDSAVGLDRSLLNARRWISTNCCLSTDVKRKKYIITWAQCLHVNCVPKFCFISFEYKNIWQTIILYLI